MKVKKPSRVVVAAKISDSTSNQQVEHPEDQRPEQDRDQRAGDRAGHRWSAVVVLLGMSISLSFVTGVFRAC